MNKTELCRQYVELLKNSLLNELYIENEVRLLYTFMSMKENLPLDFDEYLNIAQRFPDLMNTARDSKLSGNHIVVFHREPDGTNTPAHELRNVTELSHTMIGRKRLENIQYCVETVLADGIAGDFIE